MRSRRLSSELFAQTAHAAATQKARATPHIGAAVSAAPPTPTTSIAARTSESTDSSVAANPRPSAAARTISPVARTFALLSARRATGRMIPTPLRTSHENQPDLPLSDPIEYAAARGLLPSAPKMACAKKSAQPNAAKTATERKARLPSMSAPPRRLQFPSSPSYTPTQAQRAMCPPRRRYPAGISARLRSPCRPLLGK